MTPGDRNQVGAHVQAARFPAGFQFHTQQLIPPDLILPDLDEGVVPASRKGIGG